MADVRDQWLAGTSYEDFMGRWSRALAPRFVSWLQLPLGLHWLDVGCGTGALAQAICTDAAPASVAGCDSASAFVEFARTRARDPRLTFVDAGVGSLPRRNGGYGCVASLLAMNFFPDAAAALHEMRSLTSPQGTVSACVWDYRDGMQLLRYFWDVASDLDPAARALDEGMRFANCNCDYLTNLFLRTDFADVRCEAIEIPTVFAGFADYWRPLPEGTGPVPSYVASLSDEQRARLARRLDEVLPRERDGTIALTARAWAVRGTANCRRVALPAPAAPP